MLAGWQHADVISALALGVSGLAFAVSLRAIHYTKIQTRLAQRKARDEEAEREPVIESSMTPLWWPGWFRWQILIRNRLDVPIVCERLRLREPPGAGVALATGYDALSPDEPRLPPPVRLEAVDLDIEIAPAESFHFAGNRRGRPNDRSHVMLLVFIDSTKASRARQDLEASISVRRSNDRVSFADSRVVTKIPAVSTSSDT